MRYEYFLCLGTLLIITLVIRRKYNITVFRSPKEALLLYFMLFVLGTVWDNFAVWRGHWLYPGKGIVGIFVGLIPIEDYFFAMITSYTIILFSCSPWPRPMKVF